MTKHRTPAILFLAATAAVGCGRTDEAIIDPPAQALQSRCPIEPHEMSAFATTTVLDPNLPPGLVDTVDSGQLSDDTLDAVQEALTLTWTELPSDRVAFTVEPADIPDLQARFDAVDWDEAAGVTLDDFLAQDPVFPGCSATGWLGEAVLDVSVGSYDETHTGTLVLLEGRGTVFTSSDLDVELVGPNASGDVFAASAVGADWSWLTLEY